MFPGDGIDQETMLSAADTAMYAAKKNGRNQFCFFSDVDSAD
jgi:GGDEF domain-containing protein